MKKGWPVMMALLVAMNLPVGAAPAAKPPATEPVVVDEPTAATIRGALKYLAGKQKPNGSWDVGGRSQLATAMTGYTLIAFMANGHLPGEGDYGKVVADGLQWLLDSMQADGIFAPQTGQYMYGHGIATIALAELYGQTRAAAIRPKLEKAVKVILGSQNKEGGWRYQPRVADADISVSVLQVVALRAAKNAGLDVPQENLDRAIQYVNSCYEEKSGGFCYQPRGGAGFARTAAAIYSLQVCGLYGDRRVKTGSEYLLRENKAGKGVSYFTYGQFYAAPAQYMIGGETWRQWYGQMRDLLLKNVRRQGDLAFWETDIDRQSVGPVYSTAVYTTILALPYHYMPLYQR